MVMLIFFLAILCGLGLGCVHALMKQRDQEAPGGVHTLSTASYARWFFGSLGVAVMLMVFGTQLVAGGLVTLLITWGVMLPYVAARRLRHLGLPPRYALAGLVWPLYVLILANSSPEPWLKVYVNLMGYQFWADVRFLAHFIFLAPYVWLFFAKARPAK